MSLHASVLVKESLSFLNLTPGMTVVDGTLGGGGHTRMLAEIVGPTGKVIAIDRHSVKDRIEVSRLSSPCYAV